MLDIDTLNSVSATATSASIELTGVTGQRWSIGGLAWSFEGATISTTAQLRIHRNSDTSGTVYFTMDINDDGAGFIIPAEPFKFPPAATITFYLKNKGAGSVAKLNILGKKLV